MFKYNFEIFVRRNDFHHNVFSIREVDPITKLELAHRPRCWYNPGDMRYINNSHYHYANIETEKAEIENFKSRNIMYTQYSKAVIKGVYLAHDHSLRTKEQLLLREQYQRYLVTYESLVQNGYSHEKADKVAKQNPTKDFNPTA